LTHRAKEKNMPAKSRRQSNRRRPAAAPSESQVDLNRHARKCAICHHPDRDAIEEAFIDWVQPYRIHEWYDVGEYQAIYRHAHATGLFERRRRNVRVALERLIEGAEGVQATPDSIIRAVHALSRVDDKGRWIEPIRRVIVAKRAVLSREENGSAGSLSSREATSYQGEISSQEIMASQLRGNQRPLPTLDEHRAKQNTERVALLEEIKKSDPTIAARLDLLAQERAAQKSQWSQPQMSDQQETTLQQLNPGQQSDPTQPIDPTQLTDEVATQQKAPTHPPTKAGQLFAETRLHEILSLATEALNAGRSPAFLIDSAQRLENAITSTKQIPDRDSNRK
jgi:hypothetical protein